MSAGRIEYLFLTPGALISVDGQVTAFGASVRLGSLAPTRALTGLGYDARTFYTTTSFGLAGSLPSLAMAITSRS